MTEIDKRFWPDLVVVTWYDSAMLTGPLSKFDAKALDIKSVQSVGLLVHEDEKHLILARDMWVNDDEIVYREILVIPMVNVEMRTWLTGTTDAQRPRTTWR